MQYIYVPYKIRAEARQLGAVWDSDRKRWQTHVQNKDLQKLFKLCYQHTDRTYLEVLYDDKDYAKMLGAKFDGNNKTWYVVKDSENTEKYDKLIERFPNLTKQVFYQYFRGY